MTCLRSHRWGIGRQDLDVVYLLKSNASETRDASLFNPHPLIRASVPSCTGMDTWQTQHAQSMQAEARRDERSGWEMGHSSMVGQGLKNFALVIKMLIRVAPRHPYLLTSWALRHTFPRQPKQRTGEVTSLPKICSPWIACEWTGPQTGDEKGEMLYFGQKDLMDTRLSLPFSSPGKLVSCSPSPSS